jgi:hypothetical protein
MAMTRKGFIPRPGFVNKQGCLPDPTELVCIEVPKIFDQCLIKRCLRYAPGPDTKNTDAELRSDPLPGFKRYLGSRDFNIKLKGVDKADIPNQPGYKRLAVSFKISFVADYLAVEDGEEVRRSELFEIHRTEVIPRFYCPESISQISASSSSHCKVVGHDLEGDIIKLEMVAEVLAADPNEVYCNSEALIVLDITLGFHIIAKCELIVQLLIPAFDYCPVPPLCPEESPINACDRFDNMPAPKFYPDQKLAPLFPDDDDDDNDRDRERS